MLNSYVVGAQFTIEDSATPTLTRMAEGLEKIAALAADVKKALADLGTGAGFAGLGEQASALGEGLHRAAAGASGLNAAMGDLSGSGKSAAGRARRCLVALGLPDHLGLRLRFRRRDPAAEDSSDWLSSPSGFRYTRA